jgi:protein-S-isoprenylcysteine O-methyltransferase Ste14
MKTFFQALIPVLWLLWLAIWIVAAFGAKETRRRESLLSRLSYVVPMIVGGLVLGEPHAIGAALEQRFHAHTFGWFLIGLALVAAGLGFSVAARIWLGRNWSGTVTLKEDHELIRSGPYAVVRHPIYTGMLAALLGTSIAVGTWRALIGLAVMFIGLFIKIRIEERFMAEQFGEAYARYRTEVPALIPFLF